MILQNQCTHGINNPDDLNLALSIETNYPVFEEISYFLKDF